MKPGRMVRPARSTSRTLPDDAPRLGSPDPTATIAVPSVTKYPFAMWRRPSTIRPFRYTVVSGVVVIASSVHEAGQPERQRRNRDQKRHHDQLDRDHRNGGTGDLAHRS